MPIKRKERLLGAVLSATPETNYSNWVNMENYRNLTFVVRSGAADYTSVDAGDAVTFWIEASDTNDSAQHYSRRRALDLRKAVDNSTMAKQMTQITGNVALPATPATYTTSIHRQQWNYTGSNIDEYIRLGWTSIGNPELLGTIYVDMYADKET